VRRIAFESDRGGSQQIYVMSADGSNQHPSASRRAQRHAGVVAARRSHRVLPIKAADSMSA